MIVVAALIVALSVVFHGLCILGARDDHEVPVVTALKVSTSRRRQARRAKRDDEPLSSIIGL